MKYPMTRRGRKGNQESDSDSDSDSKTQRLRLFFKERRNERETKCNMQDDRCVYGSIR